MIKLGRWQYIERMEWQSWESKLFAANPLDHILDDFQFIWFPTDKPMFFRPVTMADLQYTRADRAARLNRNLRIRETEGLK